MTVDRILAALRGTSLARVEPYECGWTFSLSSSATVTTQSIWRALTADGIAVTSEDHQQQFGLPAPVDAVERAASVLRGNITKAEIASITADLRISFDAGGTLELLNTSSGYEGWHLVVREGEKAWEIVALGGGDLAMWSSG